jgi:hypothetical protein
MIQPLLIILITVFSGNPLNDPVFLSTKSAGAGPNALGLPLRTVAENAGIKASVGFNLVFEEYTLTPFGIITVRLSLGYIAGFQSELALT